VDDRREFTVCSRQSGASNFLTRSVTPMAGGHRAKQVLYTRVVRNGLAIESSGYRVPWRTAVGDFQQEMRRALDHPAPAVFEAHP